MLEKYAVQYFDRYPADGLAGRRKIKTAARSIHRKNVLEVLDKALAVHRLNAAEIRYLWKYYKGQQDIRFKEKIVRDNINEKCCVNRANEIVTFKSSFLLEEPVQYISHNGDDKVSKLVNSMNEMMRGADKEANDKSIVDWMHICGVAERLVLASKGDEVPFEIYSVNPEKAFVIYHDGIGEKPLAGVILGVNEQEEQTADVYTEREHFLIVGDKIVSVTYHQLEGIPLVEYLNNEARMGAFEPVISILNNINLLESNAVDSVEDFVNGFDVFQNCDIADGEYAQLSIGGKAIKIKTVVQGMEAKVYRVSSELNQSGVQTRVDDLTDAYLEICGMPNRNGGSSTSDTGTATIFRDGWAAASSRAKETETMFRRSERQFCRIVLNICRTSKVDVPKLSDFECEFLRTKLANTQSKVQVLCEMLGSDWIHPKHAYAAAGVFDDNEAAYRDGMEWHEERIKQQEAELNRLTDRNGGTGEADSSTSADASARNDGEADK